MNKLFVITVVAFGVIFASSLIATNANASSALLGNIPRGCDNNHSCVVNFPNGTQSVFLSNLKLVCIKTGITIAVDKLFPQEGKALIDAAGNVTAGCLTGAAK